MNDINQDHFSVYGLTERHPHQTKPNLWKTKPTRPSKCDLGENEMSTLFYFVVLCYCCTGSWPCFILTCLIILPCFFFCISWHDDGKMKFTRLRAVVRNFKRRKKRNPTFWLDKVLLSSTSILDFIIHFVTLVEALQSLL